MSEQDQVPAEQPSTQITPAQAEEKVSQAVAEVVPDGLLIEEDGDPFWVIQRVFWGIIKTVVLLAVLLFLIWLVWRPSGFGGESGNTSEWEVTPGVEDPAPTEVGAEDEPKTAWWSRLFGGGDDSEPVTENPTLTNPENPVTPEPPSSSVGDSGDTTGTDIAYEIEAERVVLVRGIIPESVQWLREAKTIGELSMQVLRQAPPADRSRQVETILAAADELFLQSANLQAQLQTEISYFLSNGQAANERTAQLDAQIAQALQVLDPVPVESLVNQKIESQQEASFYMGNAKIRDTLLRNIQTFDRLLRQQSIPLLNPATEIRAN